MRQKEDLEFAEIMGRMRIGQMTDADEKILFERLIKPSTNEAAPTTTVKTRRMKKKDEQKAATGVTLEQAAAHYIRLRASDQHVMALFSTNEEVIFFNDEVMRQLDLDIVSFYLYF